jgi:hypothetical protein
MSEKRIVWSPNDEDYNCESLGEVLDYLGGDEVVQPGRTVYFGEAVEGTYSRVTAADILDMIGDRAYDEGGEHAEDFPNVSDEAKAELELFLIQWQTKHCTPTWWTVPKTEQYVITAEDLAENGEPA